MKPRQKRAQQNGKLHEPLDAVRRMVAISAKTPETITREDIDAELERLRGELTLITSLIRTIERLAILRYEDVGAASSRGPKVR